MPAELRIAALGLNHDHVWSNIPNLLKDERLKVVAAYDPKPELRATFEEKFGGATFELAEDCLERAEPDAALVCASNRRSVELAVLAAERGLPVILEKPLANNLAGADRILAAVEKAGVPLIVNWPTAWTPSVWQAAKIVSAGELGPIWQARFHAAHNGPKAVGCSPHFVEWLYDEAENGPGAMMDYCCYGAALCRWLQGVPSRVVGFAGRLVKDDPIPNDNAVLLLEYPNAISILEASWSQIGAVPSKGATINCVDGALVPRADGLLMTSVAHPEGELLPPEPPPAHLANLGAYAWAVIREGHAPEGMLDPRISRDGQAILEAGIKATRTGQAEPVDA